MCPVRCMCVQYVLCVISVCVVCERVFSLAVICVCGLCVQYVCVMCVPGVSPLCVLSVL